MAQGMPCYIFIFYLTSLLLHGNIKRSCYEFSHCLTSQCASSFSLEESHDHPRVKVPLVAQAKHACKPSVTENVQKTGVI